MILIFLTILLSYFYAEVLGYVIHRYAHKQDSPLLEDHMIHHLELYPPNDFYSEEYRSAGSANFIFYFIPPVLATFTLLLLFLPLYLFIISVIIMLSVGLINDQIHTQYHLFNSKLNKYKWFQNKRNYHIKHHSHLNKNYGLVASWMDRIFRTIRK